MQNIKVVYQDKVELNSIIFHVLVFITLHFTFDFWWAVVLLITLHLLQPIIYQEDIQENNRSQQIENKTTTRRVYRLASQRTLISRRSFFASDELNQENFPQTYIGNNSAFEQEEFEERKMFFSGNKKANSNGNLTNQGQAEARPTLVSLLHKKNYEKKENFHPNAQKQPFVAVLKNNMCLRRSSLQNSYPKSPLYNNYKSPSTKGHQTTNTPQSHIYQTHNSPNLSFLSGNRYTDQRYNADESFGLSVHGSYFVNKSLINSPDPTQKQFSLVNKNFDSPASMRNVTEGKSFLSETQLFDEGIHDTTSKDVVVSILKEKSKRKRSRAIESPSTNNFKKIKFTDDQLDETLADLFPTKKAGNNTPIHKKIASIRSSKKRVVSTATQCSSSEEETGVTKKIRRNSSTPSSKSRFGLNEEQVNGLMNEEDGYVGDVSPHKNSKNVPENESSAAESCNTTLSVTERSSMCDSTMIDLFSTGRSSNLQSSTQNIPEANNISHNKFNTSALINKNLMMNTSLKNLKSPFKRIIPESFTPGSVEKLRKHPVYFTAKFNIDEIQKNREEYGSKGVSLKSFRYEQEQAAKRANDMLNDETDEIDFKKQPLSGIVASVAEVVATSAPTIGLLAALKQPVVSQTIAPSIPTVNIIPSSSPAVTTFNTGFTFSAVSSNSTTKLSHVINKTPASSSISFGAPIASTLPPVALSTPASSSNSIGSLVPGTKPAIGGFNFAPAVSSVAASSLPSFAAASLSTSAPISSTALPNVPAFSKVTFGFTPVSANVSSVVKPPPSFNFGAASSTPFPGTISTLPSSGNTLQASVTQSLPPTFVMPASQAASTIGASANLFGNPSTTSLLPPTCQPSQTPAQFSFGAGNQSSTNVFGSTTVTCSSSSIFGIPAATSVSGVTASANMFGAASSAPLVPSMFGAKAPAASSATFGTTAPAASIPSFGGVPAMSASIFGNPSSSAAPATMFGNTAATSVSANLFGKPSVSTTTANMFGGNPAPVATTSASIFGANAAVASSASIFGTTTAVGKPAGFAFPSTSQPSFNFGAAASSVNTFGQTSQPASTSTFNQPTQNSIFNMSASSSAPSLFGAPANAQLPVASSSSSIFGTSAPTQNMFGPASNTATNPSIFGSQPAKSVSFQFGSTNATTTTQSTGFNFGAAPSAQASIFGSATPNPFSSTNQSAAPSIFGAPTNTVAPTPFGSTNSSSSSIFGSSNPNPFGQPTQQAPSGGGGFDFTSSMKQGPSFNFAAGATPTNNAFGAQPPKPSFNFSAQPTATPSFGAAPSTPSFGAPSFGTPQQQQNPFGGAGGTTPSFGGAANPGAGFAMGTSGAQPQNRTTTRARRRLKR